MDEFRNELKKDWENNFLSMDNFANYLRNKLEKKGLTLKESQVSDLREKIHKAAKASISNLNSGDQKLQEMEFEKLEEEFFVKFEEQIPDIITEISEEILSDIRMSLSGSLNSRQKEIKEFEKRLYYRWKVPLDLFELAIILSGKAGSEFQKMIKDKIDDSNYYLIETLIRLHGRAYKIASEILVLLKSGYPDGAHARWRSLHEVAVMALFISEHGNSVAERYYLHQDIESYKVSIEYQKHYEALGEEPLPDNVLAEIQEKKNELIRRFGKPYLSNYGWAASILDKKSPTITDIEESVQLDHMRPYYKLASHNIHANPKGIYFQLGTIQSNQRNVYDAGASKFGFTAPAQEAIFSLIDITNALLNLLPSFDNLVFLKVYKSFANQIPEEFFKVDSEIKEYEIAKNKAGETK